LIVGCYFLLPKYPRKKLYVRRVWRFQRDNQNP